MSNYYMTDSLISEEKGIFLRISLAVKLHEQISVPLCFLTYKMEKLDLYHGTL